MAKSQETYSKKENEKKRIKKKKEKEARKEDRKNNSGSSSLADMMVYVDEFGNLTETPPDPTQKKKEVKAEDIDITGVYVGDENETSELTGIVSFFDTSKGFGFIRSMNGQEKYFVHVNGLLEPIKENDKVTFELERGLKGMNAVKVKKI